MSDQIPSLVISPRQKLLGHFSLGVRSYTESKAFYDAVLSTIGGIVVYEDAEKKTLGYSLSSKPDEEPLNLFELEHTTPSGPGVHLAFDAPSRQAVRDFWEAAMTHGGSDEGKWGLRPHYGALYYAAFVRDPNGFKLEVVYQGPDDEGGDSEDAALRKAILTQMVRSFLLESLSYIKQC